MLSIQESNRLIPKVECNIPKPENMQNDLDGLIEEVMEAINDPFAMQQLEAWSRVVVQRNMGIMQVQLLQKLWAWMRQHLPYKEDGLRSQLIKDPACAFHLRQYGNDCKSMTVFAAAFLRNARIPFQVDFITYRGDGKVVQAHVYPVANIWGHKIVVDAVDTKFNRANTGNHILRIDSYTPESIGYYAV